MSELQDVAGERAILSSIWQAGDEAYSEVNDLLTFRSFTEPTNQAVFRCFCKIFESEHDTIIDYAVLLSTADTLGLGGIVGDPKEKNYLRAISNMPVSITNVRKLAAKIHKLEITRLARHQLQLASENLLSVTGDEAISHIMGMVENPVFDLSTLIADTQGAGTSLMGEGLSEYVDYLSENVREQVGISTGFLEYDNAIGGGLRPGTVNMIGARPKALRYGSKVWTKHGSKKIEDINVGDMVTHPFEGETKVVAVHDHENIDIYRVHFRDGDYVDCCEDHLWEVFKRYPYDKIKNKEPVVKTTKSMIEDLRCYEGRQEYKWDVRLTKVVKFKKQQVPLDPYILGLLIGDGSFRNAITFSTGDNELFQAVKNKLGAYEIKLEIEKGGCNTYRINSLQNKIRDCGLYKKKAKHKFIPDVYKYNTEETRVEILRGLMDTDGDCTIDKRSKNSRCRFGTISKKLAYDVKEVVQSLGGLCSVTVQKGKYKGKLHVSYRCEIRLGKNPFRLKRKAKKYSNRKIGELKRTIVKIEKICKDDARCLTLEKNDGLFLTDNFVVTHNTGKTVLADNFGLNISARGIPVLNLDTEMSKEDHWCRMIANLTGTKIRTIETGQFTKNERQVTEVRNAVEHLQSLPYHYKSIAGMPFEDTLALMRRWVTRTVGLDDSGKAKPCVIIFDYLKLMSSEAMDSKNLAEFQVLGFMMTGLHNFMVRWGVPCVAFVQLNRDGISKEDTDAVSQSDRLIWLCSNFSIFKWKGEEEQAEETLDKKRKETYNRKIVPVIARHGGGLPDGDYINVMFRGDIAKIEEGPTRSAMNKGKNKLRQDGGIIINDSETEETVSV